MPRECGPKSLIDAVPRGYLSSSGRHPNVKRDLVSLIMCIAVFYPGSQPGEQQSGTAATFDEARANFGSAWQVFLSKRTEADFQAWRDQRDWTAQKYALWDAGKRLEPPSYGPGKLRIGSGSVPAARYSICTAPRRCWCTCLTSRRPNTPKKKAVESAQQHEAYGSSITSPRA
jgi:hypothetical protein